MGVSVNSNEVESVANLVGCSTFSSPFKYLGVIVGDNMSRLKPWEDVISKVSNRLSNWKLKTLFDRRALTLIKSVISSMTLFIICPFLRLRMGVFTYVESYAGIFFMEFDGIWTKKSWIGWDKILASKKNGGLGGSFLSCVTSLRRSPWLDIICEMHALNSKGIDLMQFLKKKLGNGENTSFWDDKWHDDGPFKSLYPRLHALETCKSISVASKLTQPSLIHSFRRPPRGGVEVEQFSLLGSRTTGISLPNMCDRWFWSLESSAPLAIEQRNFIDHIPTRLNLSLRGMDIPSILCPLCNSAAESTSHIFFSCPLA
ncbi:RNA-directed DNA polymerase, eukaryota, reverse transcriptase zinc-binding domain protein [Tanacetum coccineum]